MINIYYIGGSPCSGKSTIAEILAEKYGLYYFKVDDFLDKYTKLAVSKGYKICKKLDSMNAEQIWMREPKIQCKEELEYYEEIFEFLLEDLKQVESEAIITEGAAYLPWIMKMLNISENRYISITPTKEFQVSHYKEREWVPYVLAECNDKEKAFSNWMERDALFAEEVRKQCFEAEYVSVINDGRIEVAKLLEEVTIHFELEG